MIRRTGFGLAAALLLGSASVMAQDAVPGDPEVTIRQEGDRTVEEYRVNGFLYAIKVIPTSGAPYYLVAVDDDGNYVRSDQPEGLRIPSWKIFEW
ncbi:hypothetical protein CNQ84_12780 [Pseudomonas abyssi]|jgi:hypothetical protein|uniref:Uncharacterized protein n=3 Tax=Pseudomonas TaxID=286 RepID=A0A2A3MG17_9PSED|nr:DUF2782 domain-containing protein [Pseudomonadales bacterium]MAG67154.1 DUF2782 domain-containing protein [Pseudomonadales bacterium]PBK03766.1 hypothetical protein CNQ84_12780 [Pseudomonas abyssi]RGP53934.1 hypothetical protein ASB58_13205 [Halopseudomonas gallaeciensis]|tara:strand:+ start:10284 stop:10568 length:285 start_codon:yes stop_codon:yes gene_type:complete